MLESRHVSRQELVERGMGAVLAKRHFGPAQVHGDYTTFSCRTFSLSLVFYRADLWAEVSQSEQPNEAIALRTYLKIA